MSVFTVITRTEFEQLLTKYSLGELKNFSGIKEGIENTNYFFVTSKGKFVLTIFENHLPKEIPFYLDAMSFLAKNQIKTPPPVPQNNGSLQFMLKGKPGTIVNWVEGASLSIPTYEQKHSVVTSLAKVHLYSASYDGFRTNDRNMLWMANALKKIKQVANNSDVRLLEDEFKIQTSLDGYALNLPFGFIHADLFKDNVLFNNQEIAGIIDWYYSGNYFYLYDLAVFVNDWCRLCDQYDNKMYNLVEVNRLLQHYNNFRPLTPQEKTHWPIMLRRACLRFCISRMKDYLYKKSGDMVSEHNPNVFINILKFHRTFPHNLTF